jgi:hypothetical protein
MRQARSIQACATARSRPRKGLLHGASDRADALLDQRRRLADISDGLAAVVENADVPLQPILGLGAGRPLPAAALVRGFLNGLVLRADTIGERELLSAKSLQAVENLGALLRQVLEGGRESAEKLGARVGAGLRPEVRDRRLHIGGRNPPLRHFGLESRDVAFVAPALRIESERRAGPDRGKREGRRLDLLTGPIRIGLHAGLSDCAGRRCGQDRNRENGAERSMHTSFPSGSMIGLPLPAIKRPTPCGCVVWHARASENMGCGRMSWDATP